MVTVDNGLDWLKGADKMEHTRVVEHLEIALIELEYATADFAEHRAKGVRPVDAAALEDVRRKLISANRALHLALEVLGERSLIHSAA